MIPRLVCAVEGPGDRQALPKLLYKIVPPGSVIVEPVVVKRHRIVKQGELERWVEAVLNKKDCAAIIVLLDADDDAPCLLGPALRERAQSVSHKECRVVLANREFEAWFIAGIESLAGCAGIRPDVKCPSSPEAISGGKEWLSRQMEGNSTYSPTLHQALLASKLDLESAQRKSDSLNKFVRDVKSIAEALLLPGMTSN